MEVVSIQCAMIEFMQAFSSSETVIIGTFSYSANEGRFEGALFPVKFPLVSLFSRGNCHNPQSFCAFVSTDSQLSQYPYLTYL